MFVLSIEIRASGEERRMAENWWQGILYYSRARSHVATKFLQVLPLATAKGYIDVSLLDEKRPPPPTKRLKQQTNKQTNKKQIKQIKEKEENGKVVQHFSGRGTKYERGVLKD